MPRDPSTYSPTYGGPLPIKNQIAALAAILDLNPKQALNYAKLTPALPDGAEGWFAVPSLSVLNKWFPDAAAIDQYRSAVLHVLQQFRLSGRPFYNDCNKRDLVKNLKLSERTAASLDHLARHQPGDILLVAAQLGLRHRGRIICQVRECFTNGEYGLPSLAVGSILLTHPDLLSDSGDLRMDCAGDEACPCDNPDAGRDCLRVPSFECWCENCIEFNPDFAHTVLERPHHGYVSGFLPPHVGHQA